MQKYTRIRVTIYVVINKYIINNWNFVQNASFDVWCFGKSTKIIIVIQAMLLTGKTATIHVILCNFFEFLYTQ